LNLSFLNTNCFQRIGWFDEGPEGILFSPGRWASCKVNILDVDKYVVGALLKKKKERTYSSNQRKQTSAVRVSHGDNSACMTGE